MTPLASAVLKAATTALANQVAMPVTDRMLGDCREEARAVAVAVLVTIGDVMRKPGVHPFKARHSLEILSLAHDLDGEGE